jgi:hypothetical protein
LLFTLVFCVSLVFISASCGAPPQQTADWEEYEQPFYENQQPSYVDGDYYIFIHDGRYRRVRRTYVPYVQPIYIPVITDNQRRDVYKSIPKRSTVPASRTASNSPNLTNPSSSSPSRSTVPPSRTQPVPSSTPSRSTVPSSRSTTTSTPSKSTVPTARKK